MSIHKRHLKTRPVCKVTFRLPREAAEAARRVHVVGEFNGWDTSATPMRRLKNGSFSTTIDLERGREYQFRYLIDGDAWENDWEADKYVPTPFGDSDNSVVIV
jgi:1,4-alpha-glucan branching enzyme